MDDVSFTPTERKVLAMLNDGLPHTVEQLLECLDFQATPNALRVCIHRMRTKMMVKGHTIVNTKLNRKCHYQHVRMITSYNE